MCYGNLRGIREAGRTFALPTYLFSGSVGLMIIVGVVREIIGDLPQRPARHRGVLRRLPWTPRRSLLTFGAIFVLLRAFANGGSSLTGLEAISNAVSALRPPEGRNARQVLVIQGSHRRVPDRWASPGWRRSPSRAVSPAATRRCWRRKPNLIFGHGALGRVLFFLCRPGPRRSCSPAATPASAGSRSWPASSPRTRSCPRWLTKRGHRLVFSNGIIVLTVVSLALLIVVGANVNNLIPFYAIGVFTGFTMAGFGMSKYHRPHRGPAGAATS